MRWLLATILLLAAALFVTGPAAAQSPEEIWKMCFGPTPAGALHSRRNALQAGDAVHGDADVARARELEPGMPDRFRHYGGSTCEDCGLLLCCD